MSDNKKYKIAVIPGDGTGPEVVREGLKVLEAVSKKAGFKYEKVMYDFGGERYLKTKEVLPDSALEELKKLDAIYLGAVGHPDVKPGILEKGLLLKLRFSLEQYINLRPVKLYPGVETKSLLSLHGYPSGLLEFLDVSSRTEGSLSFPCKYQHSSVRIANLSNGTTEFLAHKQIDRVESPRAG